MSKHTAGPWTTSRHPDGNVEITDKEGSVLATAYGDDDDPLCWPVSKNAALIAAAPDLLAALMDAVTTMPHGQHANTGRPCDADCRVAKARAAIAKAGGA